MPATPLLLANGLVIDGTGAAGFAGDVLLRDGRIAAVAPAGVLPAHDKGTQVIDCTGHVVAPGFIDIHTHSDLTRLAYPDAATRALQGVTTEVTGNCGMSPAPVPEHLSDLRGIIGPIDVCPDVEFSWRDLAGYLDTVAASPGATNIVPLLGHGSLRQWAGPDGADLPAETLRLMTAYLEQALDLGCWGLSLGLMYAPGELAAEGELAALARVVASRGALLAAHMRSYGAATITSAITEVAAVVRATDVRFQISHLRTLKDTNCEAMNAAFDCLGEIDGDIEADAYPYLAGQTTLLQLLPPALRSIGPVAFLELARAERSAVITALRRPSVDPATLTVARTGDAPTTYVGRTLAEIADATDGDWARVVVDLLDEFECAVDVITVGSTVQDTMRSLSDPLVSIGSDGVSLDLSHSANLPHPRSIGTFPRAIRMLLDYGVCLEQAIHKATGKPAGRIGLASRGTLRPEMVADVVVLNIAELADNATYLRPLVPPSGVRDVIVAGTSVVRDYTRTGARPGVLVRRG
jgi:N-acyl-D-amino-acid deacylase